MKTKQQVLGYFKTHHLHTPTDYELICHYLHRARILTPKDFPKFTEQGPENTQTFLDWFENGFGCGDIALDEEAGNFVLISSNDLHTVTICASRCAPKNSEVAGKWTILTEQNLIKASNLSYPSPQTSTDLISELARQGWEFDYEELGMKEKYIPAINERIEFTRNGHAGLGVVRDIDFETGDIELYCFYMFDTKAKGYSMHEKGICNLYSFSIIPQDVVATRRMNREFNKAGKLWNDKLHRIEPILCKAGKGEAYWFISDRMKVMKGLERETAISHFRYIAGNYFLDFEEAEKYLKLFKGLLNDRLAREEV